MAYQRINFVDQNVERPRTYEMVDNTDNTITLVDSFGTITESGTPINSTNMNHIEDGIVELETSKMNKDFSNATSQPWSNKLEPTLSNITSTGKSNVANFGMPNFSSTTSVSSGTTISKNGWLRIKLKCDYGNDVYVRAGSTTGQVLAGIDWTRKQDYSGTYFWYFVPVAKSTKIYFTGTTEYVMQCTFFPCIGG